MKCKNCNNQVNGNYCSQCGQNIKVGKLNFINFLEELSDSVFQLNRGLLYTIKALFTKPGHTIREFLNGKRKGHFKPIAFVLLLSTFYFIISQISDKNTIIDDFLSGFTNAGKDTGKLIETPFILVWFSNNFAYASLILLPIFSLASYLSFKKLDQNYLEHIVINSYITGQQAIIYSFFIIIDVLVKKSDFMTSIAVIITTLFNFWAYSQLYTNYNRIKTFIRLFFTYILYFFFISIFLAIIIFFI